jgi:hypothetical protein
MLAIEAIRLGHLQEQDHGRLHLDASAPHQPIHMPPVAAIDWNRWQV